MISVLSVASEAVPLIKTGGLADVAGALPAAVAGHGVGMTTMLPGYRAVMARIHPKSRKPKPIYTWDSLLGVPARLFAATMDGTKTGAPLLVLDAPALFDRDGGPYGDPSGHDWVDNPRRFAAFARAAADVAAGLVPGLAFDVIHAHDWQAAMALA